MAHSTQRSPTHVTFDSGCHTSACGVSLSSMVLVQGKWVLQLLSCATAWAGMRSQGGVLYKMLVWLRLALWMFLSLHSLVGQVGQRSRPPPTPGREHCLWVPSSKDWK